MAFARPLTFAVVIGSAIASAAGCISLDGLANGDGGSSAQGDGGSSGDGGSKDGNSTGDGATGDSGANPNCGSFANPPASSFSDDFSSGTANSNWNLASAGCVAQSGNEITATPATNSVAYCFYDTNANYHVTCDSVIVKVPQTLQSSMGAQTFIYLHNATGSVNLILEGGGFFLGLANGSISIPVNDPYDPVQDLWWKLSEQGGQLSFETSPDGTTWTSRGSGSDPMSLDNVNISIGAGTWKAVATPGDAQFRCYNKPPPCE